MKKFLLLFLLSFSFFTTFAKHIIGGEVIYNYIGPGISNSRTYSVTLRLFRDNLTIGGAALPDNVPIGIFNNDNNSQFGPVRFINQSGTENLNVISAPNCLTNAPNLDYTAGYYTFTIDLPNNAKGYTITYQTCCRVSGISNGGGDEGVSYTTEIPGDNILINGITDNSARFTTGISIICQNKSFSLDFSATDPDPEDKLIYRMDYAYNGGLAQNTSFVTPAAPPYASINYIAPYSGLKPLGPTATIDPNTGIITGVAPAAGKYVVCVIVESYREGRLINAHRKDFLISVADCDFADANLDPGVFTSCDGFTKTFKNTITSELNLTFDWTFGDPASGADNTSTDEIATHTYSAAGDYSLRLIVNAGTPCADTAFAVVKVYPGFFPAVAPIPPTCKDVPVQFNDATTATYGTPSIWSWNFGDPSTLADTSHIRNPVYIYHTSGTYTGTFIVETSVGCRDTLYPEINIVDKPDFHIPNDTLICVVDTLQLTATSTSSTGTVTWSPNYMISDIHSMTPLVSPDVTTTYTAVFTEPSGCTDTKSVTVSVTPGVNLVVQPDTTICRSDQITLSVPATNALYFQWTATPAAPIVDATVRNPQTTPVDAETVYHVKASISGKCYSENNIKVKTVPYPVPAVTGDGQICFGKNAQLNATGGSIYTWIPTTYLNNPNIPNPLVQAPKVSLTYTVTVRDTLGCPKPVNADFRVNVIKIIADAGPSDTSVVLNQPLQLTATGSTNYEWNPGTWLSDPNIYNPVSTPLNNITYTVKVSNSIGCFALDTINVKVYFVPPDVYVPSAFTPTGDALNDLFRPVALGIRSLESFRVYNRWGELVYSTRIINQGWDGRWKGQPQNAGTYVWYVEATDYKGQKITKKGSVILIR